jgi:hypothetical protein
MYKDPEINMFKTKFRKVYLDIVFALVIISVSMIGAYFSKAPERSLDKKDI